MREKWGADPGARERGRLLSRRQRSTPRGWAMHRAGALRRIHEGEADIATGEQILAQLAKQGGRCAVTGWPLNFALMDYHPLQPSLDHVLPRSCGGTGAIGNLRVVIFAVNAARSDNQCHDDLLAKLFRRHDEPPFALPQGA